MNKNKIYKQHCRNNNVAQQLKKCNSQEKHYSVTMTSRMQVSFLSVNHPCIKNFPIKTKNKQKTNVKLQDYEKTVKFQNIKPHFALYYNESNYVGEGSLSQVVHYLCWPLNRKIYTFQQNPRLKLT